MNTYVFEENTKLFLFELFERIWKHNFNIMGTDKLLMLWTREQLHENWERFCYDEGQRDFLHTLSDCASVRIMLEREFLMVDNFPYSYSLKRRAWLIEDRVIPEKPLIFSNNNQNFSKIPNISIHISHRLPTKTSYTCSKVYF